MATRGPFGRDLLDMFKYSDAVLKALNDIVIILPQPVSVATTKRLSMGRRLEKYYLFCYTSFLS